MLPDENSFSERGLTYRYTKLSCPSVHGLQAVVTLTEDGLAVLACGCSRGPSLPVQEQRISVENFSPLRIEGGADSCSEIVPASRSW